MKKIQFGIMNKNIDEVKTLENINLNLIDE